MTTLTLHGSSTSSIHIGRGLFGEAAQRIRAHARGTRALIVTDSNAGPLYAPALRDALRTEGMDCAIHTLPAGEQHKTLAGIAGIYDALGAAGLSRIDTVIALGGGVVGDMAGFAAATWLRGIGLVQIPTTLLSQVDSSVGGKCGVDLPQGKNLVGAFYQPPLVLIDPDMLSTLPDSVFADGMAEVIKYGCIRHPDILSAALHAQDRRDIDPLILRSVDIKRDVVEQDEREGGLRMHLNFGHTFGHAVELLGCFDTFTHGQAVSVGMLLACRVGERLGITQPGTAQTLAPVLGKWQLPVHAPYGAHELVDAMQQDKKKLGGNIHFVFLHRMGEVCVTPMEARAVEPVLHEVLQSMQA